jgi:hypothetical protein
MTDVIAESLGLKRLSATLIGLGALLAILLAGAGIKGSEKQLDGKRG